MKTSKKKKKKKTQNQYNLFCDNSIVVLGVVCAVTFTIWIKPCVCFDAFHYSVRDVNWDKRPFKKVDVAV